MWPQHCLRVNNLPNWGNYCPPFFALSSCAWGFSNRQKHCNVLTNWICKVEKVLEHPKGCCGPVCPRQCRCLSEAGGRGCRYRSGSCEQLSSELVEAHDPCALWPPRLSCGNFTWLVIQSTWHLKEKTKGAKSSSVNLLCATAVQRMEITKKDHSLPPRISWQTNV